MTVKIDGLTAQELRTEAALGSHAVAARQCDMQRQTLQTAAQR